MPTLIVALDVPRLPEARSLATRLAATACGFKVGLELLMADGPTAVRTIGRYGPVFADAKFHDIPNTILGAAQALGRAGPTWVTAHALGGGAMLEAAREGLAAGARPQGHPRPLLLAVTILTSHDPESLKAQVGLSGPPEEEALRLAAMALAHGADGIVCSPLEAARLRAELGPRVLLATPGVRGAGEAVGDQRRTATAAEAVRNGADLIIVGRPVTRAAHPLARACDLTREVRAS